MQRKYHLLSSFIGFTCLSGVTWADAPNNVLSTITLQADQKRENENTSSAATKFTQDVLDIPFSRSFVSQQTLQEQDVQRVDEAINLVSGVFHQNSFGGGFWDNYSFRGFTTDPNLGATSIRNGLSMNRGLSAPRDMVNIESLDFLKGPAAALYGRGEMGGLLNITTKKPQWQSQGQVNLRATTEQQYRGSFEYTAPLNDEFAYRFALSREDNQSFRNDVTSERWFFSPQLSWKISDATQLDFDSEITRQKGTFDRGISAYNGHVSMSNKTFTGEPNDGDMSLNDAFYQLRLAHTFDDNWKLNSVVSYKEGHLKGFSTEPLSFENDGETLNRQRRYRNYETQDVMAQTELLGKINTDWARHEVLLSGEAGRFTSDQYQLRCASNCKNQINVYQPQYGVYLNSLGLMQTNTHETQQYFALNAQDQMFFNDQWSVLIGSRFDQVKQSLDNYKTAHSTSETYQQASPRAGINYKLNDVVSFYANYGRSFAMNSGTGVYGQGFAPEKGESFEIGNKYQWTDQSLLTLALFHMKKRNVLTTDPNDNNYQYAAGEAISRGLEIDFQHNVTDQLHFAANYAYTDAEISKDTLVAKGTALNNIPRHSAFMRLNYDVLQQASQKAGIGGSVQYVGERNGTQSTGFELPAYTLVNLNAYYAPSDKLRYQLNINNLFDKDYYVYSYNALWIQPGDPLNASLSVQWSF